MGISRVGWLGIAVVAGVAVAAAVWSSGPSGEAAAPAAPHKPHKQHDLQCHVRVSAAESGGTLIAGGSVRTVPGAGVAARMTGTAAREHVRVGTSGRVALRLRASHAAIGPTVTVVVAVEHGKRTGSCSATTPVVAAPAPSRRPVLTPVTSSPQPLVSLSSLIAWVVALIIPGASAFAARRRKKGGTRPPVDLQHLRNVAGAWTPLLAAVDGLLSQAHGGFSWQRALTSVLGSYVVAVVAHRGMWKDTDTEEKLLRSTGLSDTVDALQHDIGRVRADTAHLVSTQPLPTNEPVQPPGAGEVGNPNLNGQ